MKKILSVVSAAAVLTAHTAFLPRVSAEEVMYDEYPRLEYQETSVAACWLNTGGGRRLICISDISAKKGTKKITVTQYLETRTGNRWRIAAAWCGSSVKSYLTMKKERTVPAGGIYRLRSVFKVSDGRNTETVTTSSKNKLVR